MSEQEKHPNFLGGFLCGILGTFAFAWLGNIAMWTAGTLGFALGCWPKEIVTSVTSTCKTCGRQIPHCFTGVMRACKWIFGNKYRRLYALRCFVVMPLAFVSVFIGLWMMVLLKNVPENAVYGSILLRALFAPAFFITAILATTFVMTAILSVDAMENKQRYSRRRIEMKYSKSMLRRRKRYGLLYFIACDIWGVLKRQASIFMAVALAVLTVPPLLVAVAMITFVVFIMRTVVFITSATSNVLCLTAALATTTYSAWALQPHMTGYMLGIVAIGIGCLSGTATVATQRITAHAFPSVGKRFTTLSEFDIPSRVITPIARAWYIPQKKLWGIALTSPESA